MLSLVMHIYEKIIYADCKYCCSQKNVFNIELSSYISRVYRRFPMHRANLVMRSAALSGRCDVIFISFFGQFSCQLDICYSSNLALTYLSKSAIQRTSDKLQQSIVFCEVLLKTERKRNFFIWKPHIEWFAEFTWRSQAINKPLVMKNLKSSDSAACTISKVASPFIGSQ